MLGVAEMTERKLCPRGHVMKGNRCPVCPYRDPPPPPAVEIAWSDREFVFKDAKEALAAGFHTS